MQTGRSVEQRAEQRHYAGYSSDLRERFSSGMLSELTSYPQFVVWKYTMEQMKLKKRPFNPGTPLTIAERQQQQTSLYTSLVPDLPLSRSRENTRGSGAGTGEPVIRPAPTRSDAEVVEKAQAARNSARFQVLWNGDISGYRS